MSYDTSAPLAIYKNFFASYEASVRDIVDRLNLNFNFGLTPGDTGYNDFWDELVLPPNLILKDFSSDIDRLSGITQEVSTAISLRYMDFVGMVQSMDQYLCYASDAFSRMVDCIWSFGDGTIYQEVTGKEVSVGTFEILKKSLNYYMNEIITILLDINNYLDTDPGFGANNDTYGISKSRKNDVDYLEYKRDNYFTNQIQLISTLVESAYDEVLKLIGLAENLKNATQVWLPESFKLIAYTSLAFNLNKKTEHLADKLINFGGVTTTSVIAANAAKFWRKQILPDGSNRSQCLVDAILTGAAVLAYPGQLASFIDLTWEHIVPKYGK